MFATRTVYSDYQRHVRKHLHGYGTWPLGQRVLVGDIGWIDSGSFFKDSTLTAQGIRMVQSNEVPVNDRVAWTSVRRSEVVGAGAGHAGSTSGALEIEFGNQGAVVFEAHELTTTAVENFDDIQAEIRERHDSGLWPRHWVVVSQIWMARTATIIVAKEDGCRVTLSAEVPLRELADLATAASTVEVTSSQGGYDIQKGENLCVAFAARRLGWFRRMVPASTGDASVASPALATLELQLDGVPSGQAAESVRHWAGAGHRDAVLGHLERRLDGRALAPHFREQLEWESDEEKLREWVGRAKTAAAADDVFGPANGHDE